MQTVFVVVVTVKKSPGDSLILTSLTLKHISFEKEILLDLLSPLDDE